MVAVANWGSVNLIDLETAQRRYHFVTSGGYSGVYFNTDGTHLYVLSGDEEANIPYEIRIWDTYSGQLLRSLHFNEQLIDQFIVSPNELYVITQEVFSSNLRLTYVPTRGQRLIIDNMGRESAWAIDFQNRYLAFSVEYQGFGIYDILEDKALDLSGVDMPRYYYGAPALAFIPNTPLLVYESRWNGSLGLMDVTTRTVVANLVGYGISLSPLDSRPQFTATSDGTLLISSGGDGAIRLWGIPAQK